MAEKKKYRVHVVDNQGQPGHLSFPSDNEVVRKLLEGQTVKNKLIRRVYHGDLVDDIPPLLVPRWIEKGWLVEVHHGAPE